MALDKASILAASDLKREEVPVPEWGEGAAVTVSEMSGLRRMEFIKAIGAEENKGKHYVSFALTFMVINPDGSPMFSQDESDALGGKSPEVLERIFKVAERLNKLNATGEEAKN